MLITGIILTGLGAYLLGAIVGIRATSPPHRQSIYPVFFTLMFLLMTITGILLLFIGKWWHGTLGLFGAFLLCTYCTHAFVPTERIRHQALKRIGQQYEDMSKEQLGQVEKDNEDTRKRISEWINDGDMYDSAW